LTDVKKLREIFFKLNAVQQSDWLKTKISSAKLANSEYCFIINTKCLCINAFKSLFGISDYKFQQCLSTLHLPSIHGNALKSKIKPYENTLNIWFSNLISQYCDFFPSNDHLYLPTYFSRTYVHELASAEVLQKNGHELSYTVFRTFWKTKYSNIKIPKNFRMGQCDFCLEIRRKKLAGYNKLQLNEFIQEHNKLHSSMREYCTKLRQKASIKPFEIMYIMYDGKQADRWPHIVPLPKDTQTLPRIRVSIYGISNFSEKLTHFYFFFPHWESGANVSITILYDHILRSFLTMKHKRPATLIIQADNCVKEAKNKSVFSFAAHLVYFEWFKKIKILCLIPGHTHDLIDQEFATWATALFRLCIESLHAFPQFMKQAFKNGSKSYYFTMIRQMFDWMQYFETITTDFSNHTEARMFKFYKDTNGHVVMKYKTNCLEPIWKGFTIVDIDDIFGIQICTQFLTSLPLHIIPQPLSSNDLQIISEKKAFVDCYSPRDKTFWLNLTLNSTDYLKSMDILPNECKTIFKLV
jgi:hypothetical protein